MMTPEERAKRALSEHCSRDVALRELHKLRDVIAREIREAVEEEREACAKVIADHATAHPDIGMNRGLNELADRIRQRSK